MAEKIFTIPLRKEFLRVPNYVRSKKAMRALKQFLNRHLKREVKIGRYLNEAVTRRRENPPGRVQVRIEEGEVWKAELINAPREVKEEKKDEVKIKLPFIKKKGEVKEAVIEKPKEEIEAKEEELEKKLEVKEMTKKAIKKVPVKKSEIRAAKETEKKHSHRKKETIITRSTKK
jgi:ribosomal protein L31E